MIDTYEINAVEYILQLILDKRELLAIIYSMKSTVFKISKDL